MRNIRIAGGREFTAARCVVCITASCLIGACSQVPSIAADHTDASIVEGTKQFSAQEVAAAQKLSLAGESVLPNSGSAYDRALRCRNALALLTATVRKTGAATGEQLALLERATRVYEQRAASQVPYSGESADALRQDTVIDSEDSAKVAEEARIGLACLRRLAEPDASGQS